MRISTHNNIEPSWFPQVPATLYKIGFKECELFATSFTEKSEVIKLIIKNKKEIANRVSSKLSSLLKSTIKPKNTGLRAIQFAIKPRLRQNADIKRKCPNSLTIIGTSLKTYFEKSNLIFRLFTYVF